MNTKIKQLWQYLGIQDDEILIVRSYNREKGIDEFVIAEASHNGLEITTSITFPELGENKPFQMIQQRGQDGKFIIPSVQQMLDDQISDY